MSGLRGGAGTAPAAANRPLGATGHRKPATQVDAGRGAAVTWKTYRLNEHNRLVFEIHIYGCKNVSDVPRCRTQTMRDDSECPEPGGTSRPYKRTRVPGGGGREINLIPENQ